MADNLREMTATDRAGTDCARAAAGVETAQLALLRVAVLIRGDARQLCLIRDFTAGAATLRLFADAAPGETVGIELRADCRIAGHIVWSRDGHAGIAFDETVDVAAVLAPPSVRPSQRVRRPRLPVDRLAMIRTGSDISFASTRDISQGGVRVACERPLPLGAAVVLTLEGFRPLEGVVRWQRNGYCAISFNQAIPPGDLSRWLAG